MGSAGDLCKEERWIGSAFTSVALPKSPMKEPGAACSDASFATGASTDATESYESGPGTTRQSYRTYTPLMNPLLMLPS